MCKRGNATVNVHLSTLQWGKMQAIFLDRFPFKAGAPRGCKNRVGERQGGVEGYTCPVPDSSTESSWFSPIKPSSL